MNQKDVWGKYILAQEKVLESKSKPIGINTAIPVKLEGNKILVSIDQEIYKKVFKADGAVYERLSEHMGRFPVVMISPADRNLLTDGSDVRRKFMDQTIAQSNPAFLHALICYNRALSQRNALLKYFFIGNK